jgi:hypothetical protein
MGAIDFPDVAFDSIPHHGPADFARHDAAKLASLTVPPDQVTDKRPAHPLRTLLVRPQEFLLAGKSFASW